MIIGKEFYMIGSFCRKVQINLNELSFNCNISMNEMVEKQMIIFDDD